MTRVRLRHACDALPLFCFVIKTRREETRIWQNRRNSATKNVRHEMRMREKKKFLVSDDTRFIYIYIYVYLTSHNAISDKSQTNDRQRFIEPNSLES